MPARPIRRWLAWVVVNGLGGLLACPLGGAVFLLGTVPLLRIWPSDAVRPPVAVVATLAWGLSWPLLAGAGVSSAQWLLLHRSVPDLDLRGWALRGALLWLGGSVAAGLVLYAIEMGSGAGRGSLAAVLQVGLAGLALGVVVGVGQWATLDGPVCRPGHHRQDAPKDRPCRRRASAVRS